MLNILIFIVNIILGLAMLMLPYSASDKVFITPSLYIYFIVYYVYFSCILVYSHRHS